ncbi:MAG: ATP phosphoribosyltransferase regulatory subunit [Nanoarchaeota archaeon]
MTDELVKGFKDFTGDEAAKREELRRIIAAAFEGYGFEPAETPIIEYEDFVRGENKQDEAVSDIFKLQDKGKRNLALRYEFTFQLKRLMQNKKLPYRRYQIGPVFRDEPVSSNRLRQFTQCDVDVVGSTIKDDAEILALSNEILNKIGIEPIILINNRQLLNEILDDNKIKEKDKLQALREIDKYDKIGEKEVRSNLKKFGAEKFLDALKKGESYFKKFNSYKDILELMNYCKLYGIKAMFSPTLVRGLSYYNKNVFEIKAKEMKETLIAGGSYKFEGIQCTGISFGLDRISLLSKVRENRKKTLIISLEQDKESISLAQKLRKKGEIVSVYYGKPSKALEYANAYGIEKAIFVGQEEVKKGKYKIKDMKTGKEKSIDFSAKL